MSLKSRSKSKLSGSIASVTLLAKSLTLLIRDVGSKFATGISAPSHKLQLSISGHSGCSSQDKKDKIPSMNPRTSPTRSTTPNIALRGARIAETAAFIRPVSLPIIAARIFSAAHKGTLIKVSTIVKSALRIIFKRFLIIFLNKHANKSIAVSTAALASDCLSG